MGTNTVKPVRRRFNTKWGWVLEHLDSAREYLSSLDYKSAATALDSAIESSLRYCHSEKRISSIGSTVADTIDMEVLRSVRRKDHVKALSAIANIKRFVEREAYKAMRNSEKITEVDVWVRGMVEGIENALGRAEKSFDKALHHP